MKTNENMLRLSDAAAGMTKALQLLQESRNAAYKAIADLSKHELRPELLQEFNQACDAYQAIVSNALNLQFLIEAQDAE